MVKLMASGLNKRPLPNAFEATCRRRDVLRSADRRNAVRWRVSQLLEQRERAPGHVNPATGRLCFSACEDPAQKQHDSSDQSRRLHFSSELRARHSHIAPIS